MQKKIPISLLMNREDDGDGISDDSMNHSFILSFFLLFFYSFRILLRINYLDGLHAKLYTAACCLGKEVGVGGCGA